ncbi:Uncharacterised protein [Escherichia coli]|nr:Uncharacterised protein [Escherichia coli]
MPSPANKVMSLKLNDAASVGFPAITDTVDGADKRLLFVQSFQLAAQVFNVAVDGAVGYYAVVVIKMVQQLLAGRTLFLVHERAFSADEIPQASGQAFFRAMKPENDLRR